jgi:homoserine kinase
MSVASDSIDRARGLRLRVPGSTSNLGPGFDALGLALQVYLEVDVVGAADDGAGRLHFDFDGGAPAGENAIATAIADEVRRRRVTLPSLDLAVRSTIPIQAGLGSSAAAIVAGLRLVHALCSDREQGDDGDLGRLLDAATALEGHPDNVSASIPAASPRAARDRMASPASPARGRRASGW